MIQPSLNADGINDYGVLVDRIMHGDEIGLQTLYSLINAGLKVLIRHQLRNELVLDTLHDSYMLVISAIQAGQVEDPDALMGFARTIVRRQIMARIQSEVKDRRQDGCDSLDMKSYARSPEEEASHRERVELMRQVLIELSSRDREMLIRFYLNEETRGHICAEMKLSDTQFRLLKTRAKARLAELGRKKLRRSSLQSKISAALNTMDRSRQGDNVNCC